MTNNRLYRFSAAIICILLALPYPVNVWAMPSRQASDAHQKAEQLLADLTPEERVGQLFLITFKNRDVSPNSQIYQLIVNRHIGGVFLTSANNNFSGPDNTVSDAYTMISTLQAAAWSAANPEATSASSTPSPASYVPLFIGISQEGDGYPNDQIFNGMTSLPNLMAIGATWKPELAQNVGAVLGTELEAIGFNLLLGPSLDVLDITYSEIGEDLGTRTFGSDPYWVGEMGKAYIRGVHEGSRDRIAVIAKHFPGRGGSDRPPDEEVATVRKSLEQLKQIELAPFFAVTGSETEAESITDGLLLSHIRYQGFQGNIRATTRPVSFDQVALELLMALEPLAAWRNNDGILVSDDLGSMAVRRFYDPTGNSFDARQVARNAFQAGNDLLYMDNFIASGDADTYTTINRTLDFFIQKYEEDRIFAEKVDASVLRLLTLKYQLYPDFDLDTVIPAEEGLTSIGSSTQVTFNVAQNAVTLISPDAAELSNVLPNPPDIRERIVFITDTLSSRQCVQCQEQNLFAVDTLQKAVLRLYGPSAGGQVISGRVSSYSFNDVITFLDATTEKAPIEDDLVLANWIVFCFRDIKASQPSSLALKRFLSTRQTLLRDKKVIAFAFNAPYYLDATDISKLTAYYGIYSKTGSFIEAAARVLFDELPAVGTSPVSISGIGYDIIQATMPDPNQVIPLMVDLPAIAATPNATLTLIAPQDVSATQIPPMFSLGDALPLYTGIIFDTNKHMVPDGTVVRFQFTVSYGEITTSSQIETVTSKGVARASYRIQTPGLIEIRVMSEPANKSDILRMNITAEGAAMVTSIPQQPTPEASLTPQSTPTPDQTPTPEPTLTPVSIPPSSPEGKDWLLAMIIVLNAAVGSFFIDQDRLGIRWAVRRALLVIIGGLLFYCYLALHMPGSRAWISLTGIWGILFVVLLGVFAGWLSGQYWHQRSP